MSEEVQEKPAVAKKTPAKRTTKKAADVIAEAEKVASEIKAEVDKFEAELKTKTMWELMRLHDEAIVAEDAAKRELHVLRLRAANMASTVDDAVDKEVSVAKQKVADAIEWLHAIEKRLAGVPRDIWGATYGRNVN